MNIKFTCRGCNKTGLAALSRNAHLIHAPWYRDYKGLLHNCIYCRSCGTVHDTTGSIFGPIKLLFSRVPSRVVAVYRISTFKKLVKINNPDFPTLASLHPLITEAMIEDGRLIENKDPIEEEPTVEFLLKCIKDKNFIVRREAIIAIRRFKDKQLADFANLYNTLMSSNFAVLIEALKDKHWDVRRNAAITLGDIGDISAVKPLNELLMTERREHLVRKEAAKALKKLRARGQSWLPMF